MAESLLRSQTSSLTTFLAPKQTARLAFRPAQRAFTTSSRRCADEAIKNAPAPASSQAAAPSQSPSWAAGSKRASPAAKVVDAEDDWLLNLNGGTPAKDIAEGFNKARKQLGQDDPFKRKMDQMDDIFANDKDGKDINEMMQKLSSAFTAQAPRVALRLTPKTGRTVSIGAGVDVGRGFRLLEQSVARNKVRRDFTMQRYHERGGLKRKRLRKERWRKRFMEGFKATLARVKEMKRQGW